MLPEQLPTSTVTKNTSSLGQLGLDLVTCPLLEGSVSLALKESLPTEHSQNVPVTLYL